MNKETTLDSVLTFAAVSRCISLISGDIAKMPVRMVRLTQDRIWVDEDNPAYSPVLRKPNGYQNRIQFFANWMESKLIHGNAYVLKQRDGLFVATKMGRRANPHVAEAYTLDAFRGWFRR